MTPLHFYIFVIITLWRGSGPSFDWLLNYLWFYIPLKNFSLIWRRHHCLWRATKFRPMLGAQGLWAGRDLYRATSAVTWDLRFPGLIWRTAPFSRLLRNTRGCGGTILMRILKGTLHLNNNTLYQRMICTKFYWNWLAGSEGEDFPNINISKYGFPHNVIVPPLPPHRTMMWTILNLHFIRELSCKYDLFCRCGSREDFNITPTHFCDYLPFRKSLVLYLNNLELPLPKDDLYQVWLKLAN
jgi:hypothetical protein